MVFGDIEDNLAFIMVRQLGWTTRSWFIERGAMLFEVSKHIFEDIDDLSNF